MEVIVELWLLSMIGGIGQVARFARGVRLSAFALYSEAISGVDRSHAHVNTSA